MVKILFTISFFIISSISLANTSTCNLAEIVRELSPTSNDDSIAQSEKDLVNIQKIGKGGVIQPFAGDKFFEIVKKARTKITTTSDIAKDKIGDVTNAVGGFFKKGFKKVTPPKLLKNNEEEKSLNEETDKKRNLALRALDASLEIGMKKLLYQDTGKIIIKKARSLLEREDIDTLDDIRVLDDDSRDILIKYFFDNNSAISKIKGVLASTYNWTTFAIIATNIPGTGLIGGAMNMGKTLLLLANKISVLSAIYGYKIHDPENLFFASAKILESLEDWDINPQHTPLSFEVLNDLYSADNVVENSQGSRALLKAISLKDAYLAAPGIQMISIKKIGQDDFKIDTYVKDFIGNFFNMNDLLKRIGNPKVDNFINDFQIIYGEFKKNNYFKAVRFSNYHEKLDDSKNRIFTKFKSVMGYDLALEKSINDLDLLALDIFCKIFKKGPEEKQAIVELEVSNFLKSMQVE